METKAKDESDLETGEKLKMKCGKKHFKTLDISYEIVKEMSELEMMLNNE